MGEQFFGTVVRYYKAIAFAVVEPFDCTLSSMVNPQLRLELRVLHCVL